LSVDDYMISVVDKFSRECYAILEKQLWLRLERLGVYTFDQLARSKKLRILCFAGRPNENEFWHENTFLLSRVFEGNKMILSDQRISKNEERHSHNHFRG